MIISEYKDEILKEKNIIKLNSDVSRGMVINSLKSDELKKEHLKDIRQYNIIISIITGMKSDEIKMKLADIEYRDYMPEIVKSLTDDNNKIKYINGTKKTYKKSIFEYEWLDVIKSLKSDEIKKDYYNDKRFDECKAEILATIKDEKYIKLEFLNHNCNNKKEEKFCLKLIETIKDETLKKYLIENLNNKKYKKLLNSNNEKIKKELLKDVPDNLKNKNIDKNLTIGVELEVEGKKYSEYLNVKKIFGNWDIKQEGSLDAGIEVTSPILQYNEVNIKYEHDFAPIDLSNIRSDLSERELHTIKLGQEQRQKLQEKASKIFGALVRDADVASLDIGSVKIIFFPNEIFSEYMNEIDLDKKMLVSYSNGYGPYVLPADFKYITYEMFTDTTTSKTKELIAKTIREI